MRNTATPDADPRPHDTVSGRNVSQLYRDLADGFDAEWYAVRYGREDGFARFRDDPFTHYLVHGIPAAASPNAEFDETFYRAFYPEIDAAIARGDIPCGYYHYVAAGRREGRLPRYERRAVLEARIPGVTRPTLLDRIPEIRARLRPPRVSVDPDAGAPARIWVLLPTINPDITFGGYRSVLELMRGFRRGGHRVCVLCTEDAHANKAYFAWREESDPMRALMREVELAVLSPEHEIAVGPRDTVVVYSLWDLYAADHIRRIVPTVRVVLLLQEYEPIFYDHCSARAVAEAAYAIPHFALINSAFLARYLRARRVGVFGGATEPVPDRDFRVFEHRINRLAAQTEAQMRDRRERVLIAYARPEGHAARNMFELLVLALQRVCAENLFGPEWSFVGLGALVDVDPVDLGGGHRMVMHAKMTEEHYAATVGAMDVGVSLMYAPHPSVVPFEFATTGALVVTNTYENRSAADLAAISRNIVAGPPSLDGIAAALREAIARVPDVAARAAGIYRPAATSWDEIFDAALVDAVLGRAPPLPREQSAAPARTMPRADPPPAPVRRSNGHARSGGVSNRRRNLPA
ncbi:MAG: hypothetical protein INR65_01765 [Gluconacetobacter diazotrophicus]|nr:hypothetical protein [Gluconacetobacter diazotrophicus]